MVLRLALYSSSLFVVLSLYLSTSHSIWWYSEYPCTHRSLPGGTQTIPLLITVCLVALRLSLYSSQSTWWLRQSLYSSQSPWWYSDYPYTHHSLPGGTQTISTLITVSLVVLRLSLYSSKSLWWYSDYPYTHHSLFGGPQPILIHIQFWLVVRNSDYPYTHQSLPKGTHHSLPGSTQTIPILITVSLRVLRLSLYSSQSPWW